MSEFMQDYRADIDMWADMWDEMQKSEVRPAKQKPKPVAEIEEDSADSAQDCYFDYNDSEELLQEQKISNPIFPDSAGVDNTQPKPVWVSEDLLKEVELLKKRLFAVENHMARMGQGKKWSEKPVQDDSKKLFGEVKRLRDRIEKVSSALGIKDEPSPWQIKRD